MGTAAVAGTWARAARDPVAVAYLAAVALGLLQAWVLGEPSRTLRGGVPYLLGLLVVLTVRAVGPRDEDGLERWLRGLSVAGLVLAAWLLATFVLALPDGLGQPHGFYRVKGAVTSPVGDHNTAAGLLLPAIVAGAAHTVRDRRWAAGLAVTTLGLVATLSRGGAAVLLGVAAAAWVAAADRRLRVALTGSAVGAVVLVLGLAVVLDASPPPDGPQAEGGIGASVVARADLVGRAWEVGAPRPLLGVGLGGFGERAADLPPPNDHAHQLVAHAFAEGGVGLAVVALTVPLVLLARAWRSPRSPGRTVLLLGGLGLVAHAQVEILGGRLAYEVLLAGLAALTAVATASGEPTRSERRG